MWSQRTSNDFGRYFETIDLVDNTTVDSSEIQFIKVRPRSESNGQYVTFTFKATAITGTDLDIALYGAEKKSGTKFLLKDAVVADITDTTKVAGVLDMQQYPASVYYIRVTTDSDEEANDLTMEVFGDLGS